MTTPSARRKKTRALPPKPSPRSTLTDDDAEIDVVETAADVDVPPKLDEEELLSLGDDTESWSDDPVRMYLTQMGEIPLLTRQQEIYLAKKIELTRRRFRTKLLECDYVIQQAYKVLKRVHDGELPFDRTVQVSVTDRLEKDQILGRLPHNLRTLEILLKRNRRDYLMALSRSQRQSQAQGGLDAALAPPPPLGAPGRRARPADAAHRADDPHAGRFQPPHRRAAGQDRRPQAREGRRRAERKAWISEYRAILLATQETPTSLQEPRA